MNWEVNKAKDEAARDKTRPCVISGSRSRLTTHRAHRGAAPCQLSVHAEKPSAPGQGAIAPEFSVSVSVCALFLSTEILCYLSSVWEYCQAARKFVCESQIPYTNNDSKI